MSCTLKPGIYLDLHEEEYFGSGALGYSDMVKILRSPAGWWAGSRQNPARREPAVRVEADSALTHGAALHCLLLDGPEAFGRAFTVMPDPAAPLGRDIDQMRRALEAAGVETPNFISAQQCRDLCKLHGVALADEAKARFDAGLALGRRPISWHGYQSVREAVTLLRQTPELNAVASDGFREVSVIWDDDDGNPMRARFDRIGRTWILDLKTFTPMRGTGFADGVFGEIARRRYDVQVVHYSRAREIAAGFTAKQMHGGTKAERAELRSILKEPRCHRGGGLGLGWGFLMLFLQLPHYVRDDARAFEALPLIIQAADEWDFIAARASADIQQAKALLAGARQQFSGGQPWHAIHQLEDIPAGSFPRWFTGGQP